jgi:hypothetical protein
MISEAELLKPLGLKIVYHMVMASGDRSGRSSANAFVAFVALGCFCC